MALSTTGDVTIIDADSLEVKTTFSSSPSTVSHASMFPASTSPLSSGQNTAILVMVASGSSKTTHLRILAIDETDSISLKQESEISVDSEVCLFFFAISIFSEKFPRVIRKLPVYHVAGQESSAFSVCF